MIVLCHLTNYVLGILDRYLGYRENLSGRTGPEDIR